MRGFVYLKAHFAGQIDKEVQRTVFKKSVTDVIIEPFSFCNRRCHYCPVSLSDRSGPNNFISEEIFDKIIRGLAGIGYDKNICLNLYNEPLAEKEYILAMIGRIREMLPLSFIYFSSNGDYLTKEYLKELSAAGLNKLHVTLHPGENEGYDDVGILNRFLKFMQRNGVQLNFTAFSPARHVSAAAGHGGLALEVFSANYGEYGQDRGGLVNIRGKNDHVRTEPCIRPFSNFTISYDGSVFPCCQLFSDAESHRPYAVGNLSSSADIFEIYASHALSAWRANLLCYGPKKRPCDTCTEMNIDESGTKEEIRKREVLYDELIN